MRRHLLDHTKRRKPGARLLAYAGIERRAPEPMGATFASLFRRPRHRVPEAKLARFLAIARQG